MESQTERERHFVQEEECVHPAAESVQSVSVPQASTGRRVLSLPPRIVRNHLLDKSIRRISRHGTLRDLSPWLTPVRNMMGMIFVNP